MVNVVGLFPHAAKGQLLRCAGHWVVHPKHGPQLNATAFEEVVPQSKEAIAAYLSSSVEGASSQRPPILCSQHNYRCTAQHCCCVVITERLLCSALKGISSITSADDKRLSCPHAVVPLEHTVALDEESGALRAGVGPVMAQEMVTTLGTSVLDVLDSPSAVAILQKCNGIGQLTAEKIKKNWDESRGCERPPPPWLPGMHVSFEQAIVHMRPVFKSSYCFLRCCLSRLLELAGHTALHCSEQGRGRRTPS